MVTELGNSVASSTVHVAGLKAGLYVFTLAIAVSLPVAARAQQPAAPASSVAALTALDYFEIGQLVSKYARAIDTCSNNGYDYADLFTADGFFAPAQDGKVGNKMQGRERLAEASGGGSRGCKNVGWIRQGVKHLYVNHIITPTADGASVRSAGGVVPVVPPAGT